MRTSSPLHGRYQHWKTILWTPLAAWCAVTYVLAGVLALVHILPDGDVVTWLLLGIGILLILSLEGSFRYHRATAQAHQEQIIEFDNQNAVLRDELTKAVTGRDTSADA